MLCLRKTSGQDDTAYTSTEEEPKNTQGSISVKNNNTDKSEKKKVTKANEYDYLVGRTGEYSKAIVGKDQAREKIAQAQVEKEKAREQIANADQKIAGADQKMDQETKKQEAIIRKLLITQTAAEIANDPMMSKMNAQMAEKFKAMAKRLEPEVRKS